MGDNKISLIEACIKAARDKGMKVLTCLDHDYCEAKKVYNARLHAFPLAIAYCRDAEDVSHWFICAQASGVPIVVRSGGHHHEGMSVVTDSIVLDMSPMQGDITYEDEGEDTFAWIETGKHLGNVIAELAKEKWVIPTGGCNTVCVGGLTHGGGWGVSSRLLGMTIDQLDQVEIVTPVGDILTLSRDGIIAGESSVLAEDNGRSLFWAICGGGGGNFGVVTKFRFRLSRPSEDITGIVLQWKSEHRAEITKAWIELNSATDNEELTTACRLTVVNGETIENPSILVVGRYYGDVDDARASLQRLYDVAEPSFERISPIEGRHEADRITRGYILGGGELYMSPEGNPLPAQAFSLQVGARSRSERVETCEFNGMNEPHKVTSSFPKGGNDAEIMETIDKFFKDNPDELPGANIYLSLHGMGGAVKNRIDGGTSFPWRDKDFMLQIQAWWHNPDDSRKLSYLGWVSRFREALEPVTEGAFINFPDKHIPTEVYYGKAYKKLQAVKKLYDPNNIMRFEMSIPPN